MEIKLFGDKLVDPGSTEGFASRMFQCSIIGANELRRAAERPLPQSLWLSIVFEFLFFYLTLARYHTWGDISTEKRETRVNRLSNILLTAAVDYVFEHDDDDAKTTRVEQFKAELTARMEEYGKYQLILRESQSEKSEGTALWAFCNIVTALTGKPKDLICIMTTHAHIYDSMIALGMEAPQSADRST